MRAERLLVICRDIACLVVGVGGIAWQQVTGQVQPELLTAYVGLLSGPAILHGLSLARGTGTTGTGSSPSGSPDPPPSSASSAPATSPGGGSP